MTSLSSLRLSDALPALLCAALAVAASPARAEKADRGKPMEIVADKSSSVDLLNQIGRFSGNVVITQGTMVIRADRVEIRELPDGHRSAVAWGSGAAPVSYRQKRDGVDEYVEGRAERVEFDGRAETLRFIGNGIVRRLRGAEVVDEITGAQITWNHNAELFSVQGGTATPDNPGGRVRAVLGPPPASKPGTGKAEPR